MQQENSSGAADSPKTSFVLREEEGVEVCSPKGTHTHTHTHTQTEGGGGAVLWMMSLPLVNCSRSKAIFIPDFAGS